MLGVGDVAEARIGPRQDAQAGFGGVDVEQIGGCAVGAGDDVVQVDEEVGQGKEPELLLKRHQVGHAPEGHVQRAFLHTAEAFAFVVTEGRAVNALHFNGAVGFFFHVFFEGVAYDAHFRALRVSHRDGQLGGRSGGSGRGGPQEKGGQHEGEQRFTAHSSLFLSLI